MALNIKSEAVDALAREVAALAGKSITQVVEDSLREELRRLKRRAKRPAASVKDQLMALAEELARYPVLDARSAEDIIGYDDAGLPR